jgi:hypothetical protein
MVSRCHLAPEQTCDDVEIQRPCRNRVDSVGCDVGVAVGDPLDTDDLQVGEPLL